VTDPTAEPDNPAAYALARHIADHPLSTVQAAFRYLNAGLAIELHEEPDAPAGVAPATDQTAAVCICGHTEAQHFEDVCVTEVTGCDCGDFLVPEAAREVIARWRTAALKARADRAAVLREAADAVAALDRRKLGIAADTIKDAWEEGRDEGADELRRMADETQQPGTQADGWHLTREHLDLFVRALVNEVDYDIHKGYECGEEDGEDHYPELVAEAAEMLDAITAEPSAAAQQPKEA
jgi:hypothetical protein